MSFVIELFGCCVQLCERYPVVKQVFGFFKKNNPKHLALRQASKGEESYQNGGYKEL